MILTVLGTVVSGLVLWAIFKTNPPPLYGVYAQPGKWYYIKKVLFKTLVRLRKNRQLKKKGDSYSGYGVRAHETDAAMEAAQTLSPHPDAVDSHYFNGFDSEGTALILRICRRQNRQIELWITIDLPGAGVYQAPMHPDSLVCDVDGTTISGGGLRFECLEPMKRWRIMFNGLLREKLCNDWTTKDNNKVVHVKFSFIWEAFTHVFDFDTDIHPDSISSAIACETWSRDYFKGLAARHQTHYEQWGELRGVVNIEGQPEKQLILKSARDHSFGVRDWYSFYRYAVHFLYLENGTTFNVSSISLPGMLSNMQVGYLSRPNGVQFAVPWTDLDLPNLGANGSPPDEYSFNFTAGGRYYHVEVKTRYAPQYYHHDDWRSMVYEKIVDIDVDGEKGYGVAEWLYRYDKGSPVPPQSSTPLLKEPSLVRPQDASRLSLTFTEEACCSSQCVGGKGCQLALLSQMKSKDFTVPPGICLTLTSFNDHVGSHPQIKEKIERLNGISCCGKEDQLTAACEDVVSAFLASSLSDDLQEEICTALEDLFGKDFKEYRFAVRSSAAGEDSADMSAAGQMDTILGVKGLPQMYAAVLKCWSSHFALVAVQYRRQHGQSIRSSMGVVIQQMAPATAAGVLFTLDPVTGDPSRMTINANYGLGESVVSGSSEPDLITVSRTWDGQLAVMSRQLGSKKTQITIAEGGGVQEKEVKASEASACCLSDKVILKLAQIGVELEKRFSDPRDIEWAIDKEDTIYLLQARPVTTLHKDTEWELLHEFDTSLAATDLELLTTGNIGEMMPGAITPLTHSVFLRSIDYAGQKMIWSANVIPKMHKSLRFLASCCNTLFINLHFVTVLNEINIVGATKDMVGLSLCGDPLDQISMDECRRYSGSVGLIQRLINGYRFIKFMRDSYAKTQGWEKLLEDYTLTDLHHESARHLYEHICRDMPKYDETWVDTMANSGMSGSWSNVLMAVLSQGKTEWKPQYYSDVALLLSKCDNVESADVPAALQEMAEAIKACGKADEIGTKSAEEAGSWLQSSESGEVGKKFAKFLDRHGHRCIREGEFHEQSWRSKPEKVVTVLQAMLSAPAPSSPPALHDLSVDDCINQIKTPVTRFGRMVLRWIVPRARKAVASREWGKSVSVKMADVFKQAYWKLADMMVKEGFLPDADLLFFLTHNEIGIHLRERSGKLVAKAQRRRRILKKQMSLSFNRMNIGHPVPMEETNDDEQYTATSLKITGMPVSQGVTRGTARVVTCLQEASSIQPADILVVPYTDVGWSPYFPLISGLVTEKGGLLSHGAVVAREYGLPCIVNVPNATRLFKSGDEVILNGTVGSLEKITSD